MADLSPDAEKWQRLKQEAGAFLELERDAVNKSRELNNREDKFTVWIVGLSAAAIAGVSATPRVLEISQYEALSVYLFFVFGIFFGVIYTWVLRELDAAEFLLSHHTQSQLVLFAAMGPYPSIDNAKARLSAIEKGDDDSTRNKLATKYECCRRRRKKLEWLTPGMFFLGVLTLIIVVLVNWPDASPQPVQPKPTPEIRQR